MSPMTVPREATHFGPAYGADGRRCLSMSAEEQVRTAFLPRVRFSWGFHDGVDAEEEGRRLEWQPRDHHDPIYAAGYSSGMSAYRRYGRCPESSDEDWAIHALTTDMVRDESTGDAKP